MSVRDTQAHLGTPGDEVIVPADAGQLACLAAIDDADYIIQDEVVLKSGVPEAASLSYDLFKDCDSSEKLAAVLYGSRPNVVLVGEMTEYDKIQNAIKRLLADLPMLGRFVATLLEPVSDDDDRPSFLNRALALNSNLPFGCDKLQMADRSLMHIRTHGRFDVLIASSTRDSRNLSPPPTYKLLRLMTPGAEVDKVVFHEPDVQDNQYAVQVHNDLINGLLGSIGLNSDEVHLLPGTDPRNSRLFFTELNEEQVNTVVSQFGSKPRFQIQAVEWYRGANLTNMSAVYEVWIKKTHKETWSPMLYASVLAMFWTIPGVLQGQAGFTFSPTGRGGEDSVVLKGSQRAGWVVKIKTCKFFSCPPHLGHPRLGCPHGFGFHTLGQSQGREWLTVFVLVLLLQLATRPSAGKMKTSVTNSPTNTLWMCPRYTQYRTGKTSSP